MGVLVPLFAKPPLLPRIDSFVRALIGERTERFRWPRDLIIGDHIYALHYGADTSLCGLPEGHIIFEPRPKTGDQSTAYRFIFRKDKTCLCAEKLHGGIPDSADLDLAVIRQFMCELQESIRHLPETAAPACVF